LSFDAVVDPRLPFPNIGGKPLWMSLRALDDETVEAITALHARARASLTLAGYADYAVLDEGVSPALHHRVICDHIDRLLDDEYDDLIINTPPGAAKSTYTSHALGAYYMGRWPTRNVILATHTADLSEKWSRKVRNTIADPRHAQLFPESSLSRDSTAVSRWATSKGGEFLAAGVGASILGFRADCVTGNTLVRTKTGYTPISAIKPGDEVLAYDNKELSTGYHRVVAVAERAADLTYRIHAVDGCVVEATGNHPVYSGGKFVPALALAVGDPLLSCVWDGQRDQCAGDGQEDSQRADAVLLRQVVLDNPHEHHGEGVQDQQNVQRLWETIHQQGTWSARLAGLLGGMPEGSASLGGTQEQNCSEPQLRPLRNVISSEEQRRPLAILLDGVQEQGSQSANVCRQQSELATRERPEPIPAGKLSGVQGCAENGDVPGQSGMRDLCQHGEPPRSPCGRECAEQLSDQRGDSVPVVPHEGRATSGQLVRSQEHPLTLAIGSGFDLGSHAALPDPPLRQAHVVGRQIAADPVAT